MTSHDRSLARLRTRWSAIGAAVAITLGAGGIGLAQAAVDSGDKPITVTVDSKRILDTRTNLGLAGAFAKDTPRDVQVTGAVDVATATGTTNETVVPAGASAVLVNVTVVTPTDIGFLTLRAGGAAGAPSTSTVNFAAPGGVEPNAATVDLSADGKVQVWVFMPSPAARADVLIDVVGYTIDHNHDDQYYTEAEVDAAVAPKANSADVIAHGPITLSHSTSELTPHQFGGPTIGYFTGGNTISGSGAVLVGLTGPARLGGVDYGLQSVEYCISDVAGGEIVTRIEVVKENPGSITPDDTDRAADGCYNFTVNLSGAQAYDMYLSFSGAGSLRLAGIQSTWAPVSSLPAAAPVDADLGGTSSTAEP